MGLTQAQNPPSRNKEKKTWEVEILFHDSPSPYRYLEVVEAHEEGSFMTMYLLNGNVLKFPSNGIFRMKFMPRDWKVAGAEVKRGDVPGSGT